MCAATPVIATEATDGRPPPPCSALNATSRAEPSPICVPEPATCSSCQLEPASVGQAANTLRACARRTSPQLAERLAYGVGIWVGVQLWFGGAWLGLLCACRPRGVATCASMTMVEMAVRAV